MFDSHLSLFFLHFFLFTAISIMALEPIISVFMS
jgi:hypothetical protein